MKLACVLLAAGYSRRFGKADKLLSPIGGMPMLERMLSLYAPLPFDERIAVVRPEESEHIALAKRYGFTIAENACARRGIGTSAAAGARAVSRDIDGVLFSVADQPYLCAETVERLIEAFNAHPDAIVAPAYNGKRGNPVLFAKCFLPELLALDGDTGGGAVVKRNIERLVTVALSEETELTDIDLRME